MSENQFSEQRRVGIRLDKSEYEVAPGGNIRVNVILRNQGIENDRFALAIVSRWRCPPLSFMPRSPIMV